jgi:hypothetical protein
VAIVGVELNATSVDWSVLLAKIEEKPGRLRRARFLLTALDQGEPWVEDLSGALGGEGVVPFDPTDSTMIQVAKAYDRIRNGLDHEARESFDRFTGAFFWIGIDHSPYDEPSVRDLGPESDPEILWSSFSPDSVAEYRAIWKGLDLDRLRGPFDEMKGHRAFNGSKARNSAIFEQRFRPYFVQFGAVLEAASAHERGLVLTFL